MTLAVAVVAHTRRALPAASLSAHLAPCATFWDDGSLGEWEAHARALTWAAEHGTHAVIVQDDAILIHGFRDYVRQAIKHKPGDLIGLYVGRQRPIRERVEKAVAKADELGASWLTCERLCWGVATIIPTHAIAALLGYTSTAPYDRRIGMAWREHTGRDIVYTWPSIADHADGETVIEGRAARTPGRVAHRVGVPNWVDVSVAV